MSRNASGTTTHVFCFVTCTTGLSIWLYLVSEVPRAFQHLRSSDTSQTEQIKPFMNRSAQTIGLVDWCANIIRANHVFPRTTTHYPMPKVYKNEPQLVRRKHGL